MMVHTKMDTTTSDSVPRMSLSDTNNPQKRPYQNCVLISNKLVNALGRLNCASDADTSIVGLSGYCYRMLGEGE